jgi:hypothetical protein
VRRLTGDEDLTSEFATTWRTYELDAKTRSLLEYAEKLTKTPGMIDDGDIDALRAVGWSEDAIYEASALISFFNFSGRMEAASGLPADEVPASARNPRSARCDRTLALDAVWSLQRPLRERSREDVSARGLTLSSTRRDFARRFRGAECPPEP